MKEFNFKEGLPIFPPSYKMQSNKNEYKLSGKGRIPSWTDRVLYKGDNVSLLHYDCAINVFGSDHRPVYALFVVK